MPTYRVAEGRELSHSERVNVVVPTFPKPTTTVGYEGRMLQEGDELELPEADGRRLIAAGVLEAGKASRRRSKK